MSFQNPLNVYAGPDSLKKYFDPDFQPPLPLVEIPESLNPFRKDGVRIFAKMMTMLPANNVKALPGRLESVNLLQHSVKCGQTETIVEYSSGSTVISMSMAARVFHGIDDCRAFLSNKTSDAKLKLMQFFGLNLTLFGGPSQPEPADVRGGIQKARQMAADDASITNPNQYENDANWKAHYRWTGPQILSQLPDISVVCAGMGTSGTITGIGSFIRDNKPSCVRLGVCTAPGQRVPGPRSYALMAPVEFPWREAISAFEEVGEQDSFSLSMRLSREGLICGPSSGFNLKGLCQYLVRRKTAGTLHELANVDGEIPCVFLCCDLPYQYMGEYFDKLDSSCFPPINNSHLTEVDKYRYDEAWERSPSEVVAEFHHQLPSDFGTAAIRYLEPDGVILDFRQAVHFEEKHLPGAVNIPLDSLESTDCSPFEDSKLLARQWRELEALFSQSICGASDAVANVRKGKHVLTICYHGDTSRVANSILRAKGVQSVSCRGGFHAVIDWLESETKVSNGPPLGTFDLPNGLRIEAIAQRVTV